MRLFAVFVILMLCGSLFIVIPEHARADTYYYQSWCPSANNSTFWTVYPRYSSTPVPAYGAQVQGDPYSQDLYTTSSTLKYVETNDFANSEWVDYEWFDYQVGNMPTTNATILSVNVIASFYSTYPQSVLYFSTNDKGSWTTSSTYPAGSDTIPPFPYAIISWNVTALATWNVSMLSSPDLWVKIKATPSVGIHYYLGYLGFYVSWSSEEDEGGGEYPPGEPNEDSSWDTDYNFIYSDGGIIGIMGLIGFIGLIAIPAASVWMWKNGNEDSRIQLFVKILVIWMFCLTMFMVSIS